MTNHERRVVGAIASHNVWDRFSIGKWSDGKSVLFWRVNGGSTDFPATKIQLTDEGLFAH